MSYYLNIKPVNANSSDYYNQNLQYSDDAGVDLYFPEDVVIPAKSLGVLVGLGVATEMYQNVEHSCNDHGRTTYFNSKKYCSYWILPRSSIAKTPIRLSNSIGLIDAGYRGELKAALDNHSNEDYKIKKGTRLFQLSHPQLVPLKVKLVAQLSETQRGNKGFGSTGK